jgi:hypothetical protein
VPDACGKSSHATGQKYRMKKKRVVDSFPEMMKELITKGINMAIFVKNKNNFWEIVRLVGNQAHKQIVLGDTRAAGPS